MPETPQEIVQRELREYKRFSGDGLPNEPTAAPLPIGDPQSGVWNPKKVNLRNAMLNTLQGAADSAAFADERATDADESADRAQTYAAMLSVDRIKFNTVPALLADTSMGYADDDPAPAIVVGPGDIIEAEGFRYEVVAGDATEFDEEAAGGVRLLALSQGEVIFSTVANASSYVGPRSGDGPDFIITAFSDDAQRIASGGLYRRTEAEPALPAKFQIANGTWYEGADPELTLDRIGCVEGDVSISVAEDNSARINDTMLELSSRGGGTVRVPTGTYRLGTRVIPRSFIRLFGYGKNSKLHAHEDWSDPTLGLIRNNRADSGGVQFDDIHLADFEARGKWGLPDEPAHGNNASCIELEFLKDSSVQRLHVTRADDACIRISGYRPQITNTFGSRVVTQINVTNGGSGYTSAPAVALTGGNPYSGGTATATAQISGGQVVSVTVTFGGNGYDSGPPTVSFSGGGGSGAAATAVVAFNPDHGHANNVLVRDNIVSGGFLGIESVGGAVGDIINNRVLDSLSHGLRIAGGGWRSLIADNWVDNAGSRALYVEGTQRIVIANNHRLRSIRPGQPVAIDIGYLTNGRIESNICDGDIGTFREGFPVNLDIESNSVISGKMQFLGGSRVRSHSNKMFGGAIRFEGTTSGISIDDFCNCQGGNNLIQLHLSEHA